MYVWDEAKRRENLRKHGLDFADCYLVYENPEKITLRSDRGHETRMQDIAIVRTAAGVLSLVYTERAHAVRIISFRRASRRERKLYDEFTRR
ncbi:MAG: BrnT family toxin [Acidobacteriaceae bacterium]